MQQADLTPRPASGALTKASGFLVGLTHSLNPYPGCRFACSYCYVRGMPLHRYHEPSSLPWGDYAQPGWASTSSWSANWPALRRRASWVN